MSDKKPLLWHSNAPFSSTGYGQQTGLFTPLLAEHYDVTCSSFYGLSGARLGWKNVEILPGFEGDYGDFTLPLHAERLFGDLRGGLTVTLMDVWVLDPFRMRNLNLACWVPVDHEPTPPMVRRFFTESGAVPIAMSRFGQQQLAEFDALYCPHAVDITKYKPIDRTQARDITQLPKDKFVVGMVAANKGNPSRKAFDTNLLAFAAFHNKHPDTVLYLHTELTGKIEGVNIPGLMQNVGLDQDAVVFADQYRVLFNPFNEGIMGALYSSLDVLLATSCGEGFGVPTIEAQACGTPVIVTDFAASPELVGAGWKVAYDPKYTPQQSWQATPSVEDTIDALERAYNHPDRRGLQEQAVEFAAGYEVNKVIEEHMLPSLKEAERRYAIKEPVALKVAA